jgi:dephospho-CoA kinase
MIIMFRGKPGVGKSTIARALADRLDATLIAKDDINDIVFEKFGANKSASELSYDLISYFLTILRPAEKTIVVDCSLASLANYQQFAKLTKRIGSELRVVHVTVDDPVEIESRLAKRADLPEHRVKSPKDINKLQLSYDDFSVKNEIKVSGTDTTDKAISTILDKIS